MKNNLSTLAIIIVCLFVVSGCGLVSRIKDQGTGNDNAANTNKDKSLTDKTIDVAVGDEKVGVPECDDLLDYFADQTKNDDDNYVTKATRQYFLNKIRESIKKSIEENKGDKVQMAKECKEYRQQIDKFKAEEDSKKK